MVTTRRRIKSRRHSFAGTRKTHRTLPGEKTPGIKLAGEKLVGGKFGHQYLKLATFSRLKLGFR